MQLERVTAVERRGPVALLWLDRPARLNAISQQLADEVRAAVEELTGDAEVRAIVLAGRGRAFCAGADIAEAGRIEGVADSLEFLRRVRRMFDALADAPVPTVAAVHGVAFGGGCELAIACDFRVVGAGARLALPEVKIGALPGGGGMSRLTQLVGLARAKELVLTAQTVDARRAYEIGLATVVVPDDEVIDHAVAYAEQFTAMSPTILRMAKTAVQRGAGTDAATSSELELITTAAVFGTADREEGMAAFLEKRQPRFEGR